MKCFKISRFNWERLQEVLGDGMCNKLTVFKDA